MKIITISREFGSGGRELGRYLADVLHMEYYDSEIITAVAENSGLDRGYVAKALDGQGWQNYPVSFRLASAGSLQTDKIQLLLQQKQVLEEIEQGLLDAEIPEEQVAAYLQKAGEIRFTRTHGRREVAFLNRAWEDVLSADLLVDQSSHRQPILNHVVNDCLCRCAGEDGMDTAHAHLMRYFQEREQTR